MADHLPSASRADGPSRPGIHLIPPASITVTITEDVDGASRGWSPSSRPACPGKVSWRTIREREIRECVLLRGHGGDHRDVAGYPWNDGRWWD